MKNVKLDPPVIEYYDPAIEMRCDPPVGMGCE